MAAFGAVAELAASHHERLDGKGYHRGLPGEMLPVEARIVKVADIYQALSVDRPYRAALSWEEIQEIMQPDVGASICPEVYDALRVLVEEGPAARPALEDAWRVA